MATKNKTTTRFSAFQDLDSEDSHSCCSCHTHDGPEPDSFEFKLLRSRYWAWPEDETAKDAWPCCCTDPAFAVEGDGSSSFWECSHGKWEFVPSWEELPPLAEDHSIEECRGGECLNHGLFSGVLLQLYLSSQIGMGWGDIIYQEEQKALAQMTPQERAALLVKQAVEEKARIKSIAEHEIRKAKEIQQMQKKPLARMYDRRTGKPLACKWAEHPAENGWEAGCGKHREGCCPYFHTDEPEWAIIKGTASSAPTSGNGNRNFAALKSNNSQRRW